MKRRSFLALPAIFAAAPHRTEVSIRGDRFLLNGKPTYQGRTYRGMKIEGLLMNVRAVQAIFDDLNPETRGRWAYPDTGKWDPERNTREFMAALAEWRRHGLLAFTVNLQGGSPEGYSKSQPWENSAIDPEGNLRPDYMSRLARILDRADSLGMVAIIGYFYFGQDQRVKDEAAVRRAVVNATNWVLEHDYRNVLVEIDNESNVRSYDHEILKPPRVHELIELARGITRGGRHLLVGTSFGGGTAATANVVKASDFILLHGNGPDDPARIRRMIETTRQRDGYRPMPILINEDDHFRFDAPDSHMMTALGQYVSWGYFDPDGYQCPPVNWGTNTERKRQFFSKLREVTGQVPAGVATIIRKTLAQDPASLNTDWFGTLLIKGLLDWSGDFPQAQVFAGRWFESHLNESSPSPYSGPKSRVVHAGSIAVTTYSGHFGLALPCFEIFRKSGDERARKVCIELADVILHQAKRNDRGMVLHDDTAEFTIPDVCYFVVTPLMIASVLDRERGALYRKEALHQLRSFIDVFLVKETGLVKTILLKDGIGKSYWTRATGWLLWAMVGGLRYLQPDDPELPGFVRDLAILAAGVARVQDDTGGLHLFLNDPASPLETTGTAMCAMGLHEALRRRWIPQSYQSFVDLAWAFVQAHLSAEGEITQAYTGWAVPAERGVVEMDKRPMGWIPGFILSAAHEMEVSSV